MSLRTYFVYKWAFLLSIGTPEQNTRPDLVVEPLNHLIRQILPTLRTMLNHHIDTSFELLMAPSSFSPSFPACELASPLPSQSSKRSTAALLNRTGTELQKQSHSHSLISAAFEPQCCVHFRTESRMNVHLYMYPLAPKRGQGACNTHYHIYTRFRMEANATRRFERNWNSLYLYTHCQL